MLGKSLLLLAFLAFARAQIPSLGWCPEYIPMANFDMNRFLGVWYEAERYFQLSEVVSRCVMANYTKGPDGKLRVSNEVTNRFTGIKRVLEGEIKKAASKADEGKLHVKYTIPLTPETRYSVLDTDYDTYAVMWSCSGIGPVHAQNAWIMTRQRLAPGEILQRAYGVLDKYKISKTFFVKTDQDDCAFLEQAKPEKPSKPSKPSRPAKPIKPEPSPPVEEEPEAEEETQAELEIEVAPAALRTHITPDTPDVIIQTRKDEPEQPIVESISPVVEAVEIQQEIKEEKKEQAQPETVPEVILKVAEQVADQTKETVKEKISEIV